MSTKTVLKIAVAFTVVAVIYTLSPMDLFLPVISLVLSTAFVGYATNTILLRIFPEETNSIDTRGVNEHEDGEEYEKYKEMSAADKLRYEKEMETYVPSDDEDEKKD